MIHLICGCTQEVGWIQNLNQATLSTTLSHSRGRRFYATNLSHYRWRQFTNCFTILALSSARKGAKCHCHCHRKRGTYELSRRLLPTIYLPVPTLQSCSTFHWTGMQSKINVGCFAVTHYRRGEMMLDCARKRANHWLLFMLTSLSSEKGQPFLIVRIISKEVISNQLTPTNLSEK